jgi:hypothetical protein
MTDRKGAFLKKKAEGLKLVNRLCLIVSGTIFNQEKSYDSYFLNYRTTSSRKTL